MSGFTPDRRETVSSDNLTPIAAHHKRPEEGAMFRRPRDGRVLRVVENFSDGACGCEVLGPEMFSGEWVEVEAERLATYEPLPDLATLTPSDEDTVQ